ncbi:MAG: hypothetical protein E7054_00655 [Lentisphaerae bacterium]|nr:hypothetical protein [Lentisphaerota bacterium]
MLHDGCNPSLHILCPSPFKKSEVFAAPPVPHRKHEHLDITLYIRVDPGFGHIIDVIAHEKLFISPTL